MAEWRQLYTAVIITTDPASAGLVLDEAAHAMDVRLDDLASQQGYSKERHEIERAAKSLLLKRGVGRIEVAW